MMRLSLSDVIQRGVGLCEDFLDVLRSRSAVRALGVELSTVLAANRRLEEDLRELRGKHERLREAVASVFTYAGASCTLEDIERLGAEARDLVDLERAAKNRHLAVALLGDY